MALARVKVWVAAEILSASDLNAEFNNILNNAISLISPVTAALDLNGFALILDADADTSIDAGTVDDRIDFTVNGVDVVYLGHGTGNTGGFLTLDTGAFTATAATDIARLRVGNTNAVTVPAGTTAIAATAFFEEPNLTATGTITNAVTLYIEAAPTEGGTGNYALWVDSGKTRLDGDLEVQGATLVQNSQSGAYTTVLADANKHILHPTADNNPRTFTIDSNANVAYVIGTCITFVNQINVLSIAITSDTMTLAGTASTGTRTLAANGIATALKITATAWIISGVGLA